MIEARENIREVKMAIENEINNIIEMVRLSDRDEVYAHFDNIMYYFNKLIQDRQELNSELSALSMQINDINACLSSYTLCYYKDDSKNNWNG